MFFNTIFSNVFDIAGFCNYFLYHFCFYMASFICSSLLAPIIFKFFLEIYSSFIEKVYCIFKYPSNYINNLNDKNSNQTLRILLLRTKGPEKIESEENYFYYFVPFIVGRCILIHIWNYYMSYYFDYYVFFDLIGKICDQFFFTLILGHCYTKSESRKKTYTSLILSNIHRLCVILFIEGYRVPVYYIFAKNRVPLFERIGCDSSFAAQIPGFPSGAVITNCIIFTHVIISLLRGDQFSFCYHLKSFITIFWSSFNHTYLQIVSTLIVVPFLIYTSLKLENLLSNIENGFFLLFLVHFFCSGLYEPFLLFFVVYGAMDKIVEVCLGLQRMIGI